MGLYGTCTICKEHPATILMDGKTLSGHCVECNQRYDEEQSQELHPAGTWDRIAALEAERDAARERIAEMETELSQISHALDKAGWPDGDISRESCIAAMSISETNWCLDATALKKQLDAAARNQSARNVATEHERALGLLAQLAGHLKHATDSELQGILDNVDVLLSAPPAGDITAPEHERGGLETLSAKG